MEGLSPLVLGGHWLPEIKWMAGGRDPMQSVGTKAERVNWCRVQVSEGRHEERYEHARMHACEHARPPLPPSPSLSLCLSLSLSLSLSVSLFVCPLFPRLSGRILPSLPRRHSQRTTNQGSASYKWGPFLLPTSNDNASDIYVCVCVCVIPALFMVTHMMSLYMTRSHFHVLAIG